MDNSLLNIFLSTTDSKVELKVWAGLETALWEEALLLLLQLLLQDLVCMQSVKRCFHLWSKVGQEQSFQHSHHMWCEGNCSIAITLWCFNFFRRGRNEASWFPLCYYSGSFTLVKNKTNTAKKQNTNIIKWKKTDRRKIL